MYALSACINLILLYEHYYDMAKFIKTYGSDFDNYSVPWIFIVIELFGLISQPKTMEMGFLLPPSSCAYTMYSVKLLECGHFPVHRHFIPIIYEQQDWIAFQAPHDIHFNK